MFSNAKKIMGEKRGVTLVELVVSLLVMSILIIAVTNVFLPIFKTFDYANNMAEVNTQIDNVAALMLDDIKNAAALPVPEGSTMDGDELVIITSYGIIYGVEELTYNGTEYNVLVRKLQSKPDEILPLLSPGFFRNYTIHAAWEEDSGAVKLTLFFVHRNDGGEGIERTFSIRPILMQ